MVVRGTKRFLDRAGPLVTDGLESTGVLGDWYANVLRWRRPVALFVHEQTLLPVVIALAPAKSVVTRFPPAFAELARTIGVDPAALDREVASMSHFVLAPTASRQLVGVMNELGHLADDYRHSNEVVDLLELSRWLAHTPCSPLYGSHVSPDRALEARLSP
jgi:hypothetical protein